MSEQTPPVQAAQQTTQAVKTEVQQQATYSADYVKELREEAASNRIKAKEFSEKLDIALKELNTLNSKIETEKVNTSIISKLNDAGARYTDLLISKIDRNKIYSAEKKELDTKALDAELESLKKEYPELFKTQKQDIDATKKRETSNIDVNAALRNAIK